jgi:uncharacterized lipoprotein YddW (UPF0748 family)
MDDYFYPYPEKDSSGKVIPFPDWTSWNKYKDSGGKLQRDDWRRENVNTFIARAYREVKAAKPWVKCGVSPFGIYRPGFPTQIRGFDQYASLYADPRTVAGEWLARLPRAATVLAHRSTRAKFSRVAEMVDGEQSRRTDKSSRA